MKALRVGIPGQLDAPTAPANWMLLNNTCISFISLCASRDLQVSNSHVAALLEGLEGGDNLIETDVGVERSLSLREDHDGAVSTTTAVECVRCERFD